MDMITAIRNHILTCPYLDQEGRIGVDYLDNQPVNYSIDPVPSISILSKDILGNTQRQYLFVFASQESYGSDTLKNMQNSGFFEKFAEWFEDNTQTGELPEFGPKKTVTEIYASGLGFIESTTEDSARYAIQCGVKYEQEV